MIKGLLYELLPGCVHSLIRRLSGWILVRVEGDHAVHYRWSRTYPIT
jgi:hypothetical protein